MPDTPLPQLNPVHRLLDGSPLRDGYRLSFLANYLTGPVYASIEKDAGLTRPEYLIVMCLAHRDGLAAREISLLAGYPKNTISRAVHLLKDKGLIERRPDPSDGRQASLHLLEDGREIFERTFDRFIARQDRMLRGLTKSERKTLDRLLTKLIDGSPDWIDAY